MLVKKSYADKEKSIYKCDRCKTDLKYTEKISILVSLPNKSATTKWHLCKRCYAALYRGIEKGVKRDS